MRIGRPTDQWPSDAENGYFDGSKKSELATIMQAKLVKSMEAAPQHISSGSMPALSISHNMTTESNLTLECHNTLNSLAKKQAIELLWNPYTTKLRATR